MGHKLTPDQCRSSRDVERLACQHGCTLKEGGSHTKIVTPSGAIIPVPRHAGDLAPGTRRSIISWVAWMIYGILTQPAIVGAAIQAALSTATP